MMGRWSEFSAGRVFHVVWFCILELIEVTSGDVGCWLNLGTLVWVFVFSMICSELDIIFATSSPRWSSSVLLNQVLECAFRSPVIIVFGMPVMWMRHCVIS